MADRGASALSLPEDWPAHPDPILALNRMGSFDWDLDAGLFHMDAQAFEVFDLRPEEYDGRPESLAVRVPPPESARLDAVIARAIKDGSENYGAYFRIRCRDGTLRWTHTQGYIRRDETGRPRRVVGIVRDATDELADGTARSLRAAQEEAFRQQTSVVQVISAALAHARSVQDVIDVLKDTHGVRHLGAASLVMGLVEAGRIRLVAEGPAGSFVPGTRVTRIDEPYPMSEVVRTLTPRFIESPEEFAAGYPILWPHITDLHITSAAYLPLIAQARPIGAMGLLYDDRRGFSTEERAVLVALGSSIAQSLMRAMLYEQEKDLAQGLQQAMLPRTIPSVRGADVAVRYRSAALGRDIGGDWYDLIPLPGGRVGAVIGDVQGHDTHAAAVMGQLRIVLRAYAAEGHTPATVMARASVFLHELDTDRFATCLYAEADLSTGVVQMVRAGHIDPLVRGSDGSCARIPVEGGLPLGLSAEFGRLEYPVATLELDPGHTLLLCTDGLVEQPGTDLDDGMRSLTALVADGPDEVRDLADRLIQRSEEQGGDDDVALLLLRRRAPEAARPAGRLQQHVAPGDPEALVQARHMIRAAVRAWGARDRADEIELAADELITNALLHTEGSAVVTLRSLVGRERRLRIEVEDASSALPRRRDAGEDGVSGRGLLLVDRLADAWGVEARGGGKAVWCEFRLP
ncbi:MULTISPECIES: SpoIIE family protein phosphatase [Streptomyces]|uniref:SpoIIE family protein phosphatase n=1 Tax=Streptomyces bangladeshensis TaxID=295352 RepID=A0ABN3BE27_9ACTN|nr:SpoIIE family protein phosphatase [Streptomyces sp. EAS-AB2608]MYU26631.1 SpoIIE family protein phosphatase [Streptomyces sp. SID7810]BCM65629.1 putative magnesium or manganese-dependent protein phosphatase [Streptomyces sp. EAS-AB2608]CUW25448.1 Phosphoserine phosphatase RsbP [Streptomyces reticuli]